MYQSIAKPPIPHPRQLTRVKRRTVGNLTQNEARLVGHLNFVSKHLSVVGNKKILQFFDSAHAPHSQVIPCGFFCCCRHIIAWNMSFFKVWTEDKLLLETCIAKPLQKVACFLFVNVFTKTRQILFSQNTLLFDFRKQHFINRYRCYCCIFKSP